MVHALAVTILGLGLAVSASAGDVTSPKVAAAHPSATSSPRRRHWYEVGVASWYGQQFQGRRTAAGERFDMNSMTCAHPTLPMGTWLKVTNLHSRQTAFVRVNDRGPVLEGRIVDLSFAAAHAVGLHGVGRVRLEAIAASDPALAEGLMAQVQMPGVLGRVRQ
ncbi:MAG: septal ring lytic transglycosylase RlpA family protein [Acidobacteriota bacterium]|nr:septal ring lytic transglycosylase RlpA family protein [Acidobacteriota bacterium]